MKGTKRILGVILSLALLISATPVCTLGSIAAPSANAVIYLATGGNGTGATPDAPVGSLASAVKTVADAGGGTIVLTGPTELTGNILLGNDSSDVTIRITSVYNGVDYREKSNAALVFTKAWINVSAKNNFEYENVDFLMNGGYCSFFGNGYRLTFGKGVKTVIGEGLDPDAMTSYPNIYGGSAHDLAGTKNFPADTSVTVLSGTFRRIIAGGLGNAEKPRPSLSATLAISKDVKMKDVYGFTFGDTAPVEGEKVLIYVGEKNPAFASVEETATNVVTTSGNGYIQGISPGRYNLCAESGYGAKIGDEILPNGEYKSDGKGLSVTFVESDINRAAELAATRPYLPAAFPGEYIKGYEEADGTMSFRPSGNITIAESATILVRLMTTEEAIKGKNTTDRAKVGDWYYDSIAYLDKYEAFETFDSFDPNRQITRGEFVELISTFKKLVSVTDEIKFTDVPETHKYYESIKKGTMAKLVNGYENSDGTFSFRPDAPITRAEVVTVINRVFGIAELAQIKYKDKLPSFIDVEETHWAAFQIIAAAGGKDRPVEKADLTGSGEVEHTVEGVVVFVRDNAPEDGDGSSYEKAVKWTTGYGKIKESGTMVVCGPVEFNSNFRVSNGHTGTQLITSVYGGVDYRETKDAAIIFGSNWRNGTTAGTTIFDNIAFISRGTNNSFYCDNQNVTFGKDVVCVTEEGAPIAIYGGSANDLSACRNYIGSTDTSIAHNGRYFSNLTINGGTWGSISGTGNGSVAKPRESNGAAITLSDGAIVGSVSLGDRTTEGRKVNGLRTLILNNCKNVIVDDVHYDIIVRVDAEAEARVVDMTETSVTVKVTANDGSKVSGVGEDGTVTFEKEGSLVVSGTGNAIKAASGDKAMAGSIDDEAAEAVSDEYIAELDALEAKRIAEIRATKSDIKPKEGRFAYYVSNDGNDENDGKTPETAWKTIARVNMSTGLMPGDVVYFNRGDEWRGTTLKTRQGVSYSAYGESENGVVGEKPIINISPFDGAKKGKWTAVEGYPNIYVYSEAIKNDVGSISFNNRTFTDIYAQKMCFDYKDGKPYLRENTSAPVEDVFAYMKNDLDFWHDCGGPNVEAPEGKGQLYLRSDKGNPAERFTNIEFNQRINGISATNNVTIDNIAILHAGAHGVSSGTVNNLKVQNCVFEWIGGGMQNYSKKTDGGYSFTRFGNAVEVYGGCDGYTVDNCYISQVYDAGVTHQVSHTSAGDFIMKNVTYSNNVITRCVYSIEHFNRAAAGTTRYLVNILYKNNLCRFAGDCFGGATRPDKSVCSHIRSGTIVDAANFVIEGNVFDRSTQSLFNLQAGGDEEIEWRNNVYIHRLGAKYGTMTGVSITYNSNISNEVAKYFKHPEENNKYLFVKD